mgnify:CR=1 FL=1
MYILDAKGGAYFLQEGNPLIVGRWGGCDIVLDSPHASRTHAIFWRIGDFVYMRAMGSEIGVNLNGRTVFQGRLSLGDELDIDGERLVLKRSVPAGCVEQATKMDVLAADLEYAHTDTEFDNTQQFTGKFFHITPRLILKLLHVEQLTGELTLFTDEYGTLKIYWVKGEMLHGQPVEFFTSDFVEKVISLPELRFNFDQQTGTKIPQRNIQAQTGILLQVEGRPPMAASLKPATKSSASFANIPAPPTTIPRR